MAKQDGYPKAERLDLIEELHGHRIADPYRWLEDADDPRTREWSEQQDELFAAARETSVGDDRRAAFRARLTELADAGHAGPPSWRGRRGFFLLREPGQEHAALLALDGGAARLSDGGGSDAGGGNGAGRGSAARVLVDPGALDPSGATTLDGYEPSPDGTLLAYLLSEGGTEEALLRVVDVASGKLVDGPIDRARYSEIAWLPDGKAFYYTRRLAPDQVPEGESQYHRRVYLHRLGADTSQDVLVFGEGREKTNYYDPFVSHDGRWLIVGSTRGTAPRNDVHVADLASCAPERPEFVAVQEGVDRPRRPVLSADEPGCGQLPALRRRSRRPGLRPLARGGAGGSGRGARGLRDPRRRGPRNPARTRPVHSRLRQ
jgi:prolyl oligopeptidase